MDPPKCLQDAGILEVVLTTTDKTDIFIHHRGQFLSPNSRYEVASSSTGCGTYWSARNSKNAGYLRQGAVPGHDILGGKIQKITGKTGFKLVITGLKPVLLYYNIRVYYYFNLTNMCF